MLSTTHASDARIVADRLTYALPDGRELFHDLTLSFGRDRTKLHTVQRQYYALVHGEMQHNEGTVNAPIGRDPKE